MNWKKLFLRILFPSPVFLCLFAPAALTLLVCASLRYQSTHVISIVSYVLSFYALILVTLRIPDIVRWIRRFRSENRYAVRLSRDVRLRMNLSLYGSFVYNAIYAVFQLALGLWHHSAWFYSMAGYYLLLALMRLMLVKYTRNYTPGEEWRLEWKKYRLCGVCLLAMTLTLMVFILYYVWRIREFRHHEITTIAMAAYTFSALGIAIANAVRYRRYGSPVYSAAKAVSLVSAVVSVLTLENAMLTTFGQEGNETFSRIMLGFTGMAVVLTVQGIAVYMIINARRKLRELADDSCTGAEEDE